MRLDDLSLSDSFEVFGHWWLPEAIGDKVPGTLSFSPSSGAVLVLQGIFNHPDLKDATRFFTGMAFQAELVYGEQPDGRQITLYRVFVKHIGVTSSFNCLYILAGSHIGPESVQKPATVLFSFENIEEWSCAPLLQAERASSPDRTSYSFTNKSLQLLTVTKSETHPELELFGNTISSLTRNDATFERKVFFRTSLENSEVIPMLEFVHEIGQLLTIFIGVPTTLVKLRYFAQPDEEVNVFFERARQTLTKKISSHDMPFTLPDLGNFAAPLFSAWLTSMTLMRSVYSTFFSTLFNDASFIDTKFQSLAQALEGLHRRTSEGKYLDANEYSEIGNHLIAAIPNNVSSDLRQRLKNTIKYGNEFSLRKRLKDMINGLDVRTREILKIDHPSFQSDMVDARNYYAHLDEASKPSCVSDNKTLYYMNQRLSALFLILALKKLGMPENVWSAV